jgi:hypothetical protein
MWIRSQGNRLVNVDRYESIDLEKDRVVARRGREYCLIFQGDPAGCEDAFQRIAETLAFQMVPIDTPGRARD